MEITNEVRIDKWLWAVRLYKTRTLAAEACKAGHVKISDHAVKPARPVHLNDVIVAQVGETTRTVKVVGMVERRVGAKLVAQFLEDQTPAAEYQKLKASKPSPAFVRPKGSGRPTKKDRRTLIRDSGDMFR